MKTNKNIEQLAAKLNADIDVFPTDSGYSFNALAPDGFVWIASGGCSLVSVSDKFGGNTKAEALADLYERMQQGLETDTK